MVSWAHALRSLIAAFLASLVEFVEALTVVLAVGTVRGWRPALLGTGMLEGIEVVFIVIAVGAASGLLLPASVGAGAALPVVVLLGLVLHRPLAKVPENALKFAVGILLAAFGTFWLGEGVGVDWPGADRSLLGLIAWFLLVALAAVRPCRARRSAMLATADWAHGRTQDDLPRARRPLHR